MSLVSLEDREHKENEVVKDQLVLRELPELEEYLVEMVVQVKMVSLVLLVTL